MDNAASIRYAGFWIRLWATLIDVFLLLIIILPLLVFIYGDDYIRGAASGSGMDSFTSGIHIHGVMDFLITYVFPTVAVLVFWRYRSATPGKMAVHARIVDAQSGEKPTFGQFIGRYFAYIISTIPFGLGFLWIALDKRKQSWHDKLAGTLVVR